MILIASALFPPEPVVSANISYDLATKLAESHEVVVVSPKPSRPYGMKFKDASEFTGFKHYVLGSYTHPKSSVIGRLRESFSLGLYIARFIENHHQRIEVVYANVWPLFSQFFLSRACKKYGIPYVVHVQDVYPESLTNKIPIVGSLLKKLFLPMDKYTLLGADSVIAISNQMREGLVLTRQLVEESVYVIRNWQNDSLFQGIDVNPRSAKSNQDKFTFLYLGSVSPTAGVELLIHAFAKANLKNARLVIAGNGSDKEKCMKAAAAYGSNIQFIDAMPDQAPKIQARADVLMLPLKSGIAATALPSKMTAYMLSAKPIIASVDQPSEIATIILENSCGWVTPPENVKELTRVMIEVYDMPKERLSILGEHSLKFANNSLSRKVNLNRLALLVEKFRRLV